MTLFLNIAISLLMGCLTAYFASKRNRNPAKWFIVGLFLGLIGIIILFVLPIGTDEEKQAQIMDTTRCISYTSPVLNEEIKEDNDLQEWFYLDKKHQQHGPVSLVQIQQLDKEDQLSIDGFVWKEGMANWKKMVDVPEIKRP